MSLEPKLAGPLLPLAPQMLAHLSLILHEWATNAFKYGVLGHRTGQLAVSWGETGGGITLDWIEHYDQSPGAAEAGHPSDAEASGTVEGSGFGSVLVEGAVLALAGTISQSDDAGHRRTTLRWPQI